MVILSAALMGFISAESKDLRTSYSEYSLMNKKIKKKWVEYTLGLLVRLKINHMSIHYVDPSTSAR